MSAIYRVVRLTLAGMLTLVPVLAAAQSIDNYPARPIKLIVPFPPGGGTDMFGRVVAQRLTDTFGWNVLIENRPGAGGNIGVHAATQAAPDGYTVVLGQTSNLAINPTLYDDLPYDPIKDLEPIVLVAESPIALAVGADSRLKSLSDIVSASRKEPGSVSLGFSGNGTVSHLTGAFLQNEGKIKLMMVPYKGAANAMTDLMGNRIDVYMSSVPTLLGYVRDKKLRAIGITSAKRIGVLPDTPALAETPGLDGFVAITWFGLLAPAGTPAPIIKKINAAVNEVLRNQKVIDKFESEGSLALGGSPDQFKTQLVKDKAMWAKVIKDGNVKRD